MTVSSDNPLSEETHPGKAGRWFMVALIAVSGLAVAAAVLYRPRPEPAPEAIASDQFLKKGHALYQMRCVSCHGTLGKGDGPISKSVGPPPPGDFTDGIWKHGDRPDEMLKVISQGVPGTQMSGWVSAFSASELKAVSGYVYHLAGKPVPPVYREGWQPDPGEDDEDDQ